jgi:hypothetical protein
MSKLLEARDILAERGLTQDGNLENLETGCVCALGALNIAYTGESGQDTDDEFDAYSPADPEHEADIEALARAVRKRGPIQHDRTWTIVYAYNDLTSTTEAEVLSLFTEAAASLD